jgi:arginase
MEAGVVTEQRYAGVGGAPAALGDAVADRLQPEKRVRIPFLPRDRWLTAAREACWTLADAVAASRRAGARCVILGGECTLVAGSIPGALEADAELMLVYFDAHGDFNTLATTPSHYVGGMCLAHVSGRAIAPLLWPGAKAIREDHVVLVGGRKLDVGEAGNLSRSRVTRIPFDGEHGDGAGLLSLVRKKPVWVHIDIDVVDPTDMPAVPFPEDGGPSLESLRELLRGIASVGTVRGVELCGYDTNKDADARCVGVLVETIASAL